MKFTVSTCIKIINSKLIKFYLYINTLIYKIKIVMNMIYALKFFIILLTMH
jgi:hypothetical protein